MKPKKTIVERIATITPIATRNTPFTISLTMPQMMPNTQKAVRMIREHIASPMYCAICLKSIVAVIMFLFEVPQFGLSCRIGICEVLSCPLPCIPPNVRIGTR